LKLGFEVFGFKGPELGSGNAIITHTGEINEGTVGGIEINPDDLKLSENTVSGNFSEL
jgi:hypothetical protein